MIRSLASGMWALLFALCVADVSSAATIRVGLVSFDDNGGIESFNITNLTGLNALLPDYPVETLLTFTVTSLTAHRSGGAILSLDGGAFATDGNGNVGCTAPGDASTGGCNFAAYDLLGAEIAGTLSPLSGLTGLPPGFIGIAGAFSATLTPSCQTSSLEAACDSMAIEAELVPDRTPAPVPEPSTVLLLMTGIGMLGRRALRSRVRRA